MSELTLDEIGKKYGTDKTSDCHGYLEFYDKHFSHLRHKDIKILEIGILGGKSIQTLREYFTKATIHGVDIVPDFIGNAKRLQLENVQINFLDQSDKIQLEDYFEKHGPFDIVIDDGSHVISHQKLTLKIGLDNLPKDGIYVLEDLHTSLPSQGRGYIDDKVTALETVNQLHDYEVDLQIKDTKGYPNDKSITAVIKGK